MPDRILEIIEVVARHFGLGRAQILASGRSKTVACARAIAIRLARDEGYSYPELGRAFGNRDHTTIMAACKRVSLVAASNSNPWYADHFFTCLRNWNARREELYKPVRACDVRTGEEHAA